MNNWRSLCSEQSKELSRLKEKLEKVYKLSKEGIDQFLVGKHCLLAKKLCLLRLQHNKRLEEQIEELKKENERLAKENECIFNRFNLVCKKLRKENEEIKNKNKDLLRGHIKLFNDTYHY